MSLTEDQWAQALQILGAPVTRRRVRIASAAQSASGPFTARQLARMAGLPRTKIYEVIGDMVKAGVLSETEPHSYPLDWGEYTRNMRRSYREARGLPRRGTVPRRYSYDPGAIIARLDRVYRESLDEVEAESRRIMEELADEFAGLLCPLRDQERARAGANGAPAEARGEEVEA